MLNSASTTDQALGCLFMDVMHFLGNSFDPTITALSLSNGGCLYRRQGTNAGDPVVIIDPLRHSNNVARNCFRFAEIQRYCGDVLHGLSNTAMRMSPRASQLTNELVSQLLHTGSLDKSEDSEEQQDEHDGAS